MVSQITVTDAKTNQPIVGAIVHVSSNPSSSPEQTDNNGIAQVDTSGVILSVMVIADGYQSWLGSSFSSAVTLVSTVPATNAFTFTV